MYCHKCGNKSPEEARFCHKCGTKVIVEAAAQSSQTQPSAAPLHQEQHPEENQNEPVQHPTSDYPATVPEQDDTQMHDEYSDYPVQPVVAAPSPTEQAQEYMEYTYFPTQQDAAVQDEKKGAKDNVTFIDYPIQPVKPKPATPEPPIYEYAIKTVPAPPIKKAPVVPPAPPVSPKIAEPQKPVSKPAYNDFSQTSPPPTPAVAVKPVETQKTVVSIPNVVDFPSASSPQIAPKPAEPQGQLDAPFVDFLSTTLPPHVVPNPTEPLQPFNENSVFVNFPSSQAASPGLTEPLRQITDNGFMDFPAPAANLPPLDSQMRFADNLGFPSQPTAPRQIDTELLFMDDSGFANFTPHQTAPKPVEPDLLFMDKSNFAAFPSLSPEPGDSMPQPMPFRDFQPQGAPNFANEAPDFNGFSRNAAYEANEMVAHTPKKGKGAVIFTCITGVIFIAVLIFFLVFIRGGISTEQLVGTWTPRGEMLIGSWDLRMQFNEDGTGQQYRSHVIYRTVEDVIPFEWRVEGRNQLILINVGPEGTDLRWPEESTIQISTRTGEPVLHFRPEGQSVLGDEFRQVTMQE